MSHHIEADIGAARVRAEETLVNVKRRIESMQLRPEVEEQIIADFRLDEAERAIANGSYSAVEAVRLRASSFFAAVNAYAVYNFNLEKDDYNAALKKAAEYFTGTGDAVLQAALKTTDDELVHAYIRAAAREGSFQNVNALLEAANQRLSKSSLYHAQAAKNAKIIAGKNEHLNENDSIQAALNTVSDAKSFEKQLAEQEKQRSCQEVETAVRNRVLTAIIKIIKQQGFIVKKENVTDMGDYAKISAIKANGERVEFAVYLSGKFAYKFHEYEGLSCEKDIGNFEEQFENIYGVKLENKNIKWSNPDRIAKMAHQTMQSGNIGG
jgi:hypothetical protein